MKIEAWKIAVGVCFSMGILVIPIVLATSPEIIYSPLQDDWVACGVSMERLVPEIKFDRAEDLCEKLLIEGTVYLEEYETQMKFTKVGATLSIGIEIDQ